MERLQDERGALQEANVVARDDERSVAKWQDRYSTLFKSYTAKARAAEAMRQQLRKMGVEPPAEGDCLAEGTGALVERERRRAAAAGRRRRGLARLARRAGGASEVADGFPSAPPLGDSRNMAPLEPRVQAARVAREAPALRRQLRPAPRAREAARKGARGEAARAHRLAALHCHAAQPRRDPRRHRWAASAVAARLPLLPPRRPEQRRCHGKGVAPGQRGGGASERGEERGADREPRAGRHEGSREKGAPRLRAIVVRTRS